MEYYKIHRDLINATLSYLGMCPYKDVFGLVEGFKQLEKVSEEDSKQEVKKK